MAVSEEIDQERKKRMYGLLPKLIKITPSDIMVDLQCLSDSQREEVRCKEDNKGPMKAAMQLFDILWKREQWFEQLLQALTNNGHSSLAKELEAPERGRRDAGSQPSSVSSSQGGSSERRPRGPIVQETASGHSHSAEPEACVSRNLPTITSNVAPQQNADGTGNARSQQSPRQGEQKEDEKTAAPAGMHSQDSGNMVDAPKDGSRASSSEAGRPVVGDPSAGFPMANSAALVALEPRGSEETGGSTSGLIANSPAPVALDPVWPEEAGGSRSGQDGYEENRRGGGAEVTFSHRSVGAPTEAEEEKVPERGVGGTSSEVVNADADSHREALVMSTPAREEESLLGGGAKRGLKESREQDNPQDLSTPDTGRNVVNQSRKASPMLQLPPHRDNLNFESHTLNDLSPTKQLQEMPKFNIPPSVDTTNQESSHEEDTGGGEGEAKRMNSEHNLPLSSLDEPPDVVKALDDLHSCMIEISSDPNTKSKEITGDEVETCTGDSGNVNDPVNLYQLSGEDRNQDQVQQDVDPKGTVNVDQQDRDQDQEKDQQDQI